MAQIIAYKCDTTGKIFEEKTKYRNHLRSLARERATKRRLQLKEAETDAWWQQAYNREMEIDDFPQFVINNQTHFWAEAARADSYNWERVGKKLSRRKDAPAMPIPELLEFTVFSVRWQDSVSNSHSRPRDGVTNWGGDVKIKDGSPAPRGYPGWAGRVEWIVRWPHEYHGIYLGSDLFRDRCGPTRVSAYTGTGGGGHMRYSEKHKCHIQGFGYDFRIFAQDWPGMYLMEMRRQWVERENYRRHKVWQTLGGVGSPTLVTEVPEGWTPPDVRNFRWD